LQKLAVVLGKNVHIFAKFFGENIFKNHNIGPRFFKKGARQKLFSLPYVQGQRLLARKPVKKLHSGGPNQTISSFLTELTKPSKCLNRNCAQETENSTN
jgi:hypothetical protein